MPKPKMSMAEYAKANPVKPGGKPCWCCSLPKDTLAEINQAKRDGTALSVIQGFLMDIKGYRDVTRGKLEGHFINSRHHERGNR